MWLEVLLNQSSLDTRETHRLFIQFRTLSASDFVFIITARLSIAVALGVMLPRRCRRGCNAYQQAALLAGFGGVGPQLPQIAARKSEDAGFYTTSIAGPRRPPQRLLPPVADDAWNRSQMRRFCQL